jgi:hypothetical protein
VSRWSGRPPRCAGALYPTRVPYEESSTFSSVHVSSPDLRGRHPLFRAAQGQGVSVVLSPGDTLLVSRAFPSSDRPISTETYLWHACSYHEIN